jgi:uncharacterized protein (TIGR00296 family)
MEVNEMQIEDETGIYLVKLARLAAQKWIVENQRIEPIEPIPAQAETVTGAFVTVKTRSDDESTLRGCIGYPIGIKPLFEEVIDLAKSSTLEDPRFPPVDNSELSELVFEVTIMTPPQTINYENPQELLDKITVPGDGLIVDFKGYKGLLLPQVPVEQNWNKEEFLSFTCRKAFLPTDIWKKEKITVRKFQGVIFSEESPNGEIVRH